MKKSIKKFLEFNGRAIYFLNEGGQYWVAIRPLCEVLNVSYTWQLRLIKKHRLYRDVYANKPMRDSKNRLQKMVALLEKRIYFWLSQLPIKSDEQFDFAVKCADLMHDYFHGSIAGRQEALLRKAEIQIEKEDIIKELQEDERYQRLQELVAEEMREGKVLKKLDSDLLTKQLNLFQS